MTDQLRPSPTPIEGAQVLAPHAQHAEAGLRAILDGETAEFRGWSG